MNYYAGEPMHDPEACDCGSTRLVGVTCPDTQKCIDQCQDCGDCGSHLCDNVDCPSNEALKARLKDEEAIADGEARYRQSVLADEI